MRRTIETSLVIPPPPGLDYRTAYGGRTPDCRNVIIKDGELKRAPVLSSFGSQLDGRVCFLYDWHRVDGSHVLVAATKRSLYYYDAADGWTLVEEGCFSGNRVDRFSMDTLNDMLIICNGMDSIKTWDGSASELGTLEGYDGYAEDQDGHYCEFIRVFGSYLMLFGMHEMVSAKTDSNDDCYVDISGLGLTTIAGDWTDASVGERVCWDYAHWREVAEINGSTLILTEPVDPIRTGVGIAYTMKDSNDDCSAPTATTITSAEGGWDDTQVGDIVWWDPDGLNERAEVIGRGKEVIYTDADLTAEASRDATLYHTIVRRTNCWTDHIGHGKYEVRSYLGDEYEDGGGWPGVKNGDRVFFETDDGKAAIDWGTVYAYATGVSGKFDRFYVYVASGTRSIPQGWGQRCGVGTVQQHNSDVTVGEDGHTITNNSDDWLEPSVGDYIIWDASTGPEVGVVTDATYQTLHLAGEITINGGPLVARTYHKVDENRDCSWYGEKEIGSADGEWENTSAGDYLNWNPASDDEWAEISVEPSEGMLTLSDAVSAITRNATTFGAATSVTFPFRFRWSDVGDADAFTDTNYVDLLEAADPVLAAEVWGMNLVLFHEERMSVCAYVGSPNYFNVRPLNTSVGIRAPHTLRTIPTDRGDALIWLGNDGVYVYGGGSPNRVSGSIESRLFEDAPPELMRISTSAVFPPDDLYVLFTPNAEGELNRVWFFNYRTGQWTRGEMDDITAAVAGAAFPRRAWMERASAIARSSTPFDWVEGLSDQQSMVLLGDLDGNVWSVNSGGSGTDEASWESPPIIMERDIRVMRIEVTGKGHPIHIEWSDDEGETWRGEQVIPLNPNAYEMHKVFYNIVTRRARFRLTQAAGVLSVKRVELFYKEMNR